MKANSLLCLALMVVACGAFLPEVQNAASQTADTTSAQVSNQRAKETESPRPAEFSAKPETARRTAQLAGTRLSAGVADILKMIDGGIDPAVIETYIQNSNIAYYPSADEILQLHKAGVPSQIITALIRRGTELRGQHAQAYREMQEKLAQPRPSTVAPLIEQAAPSAPVIVPQVEYNYHTYPAYSYPAYSYGGYYPAYSYGWTLPFYSTFYYQASRPLHSALRRPNIITPRPLHPGPVFRSGSHRTIPINSSPRSSIGHPGRGSPIGHSGRGSSRRP
jgi:hypothetical protein